LAEASCIVTGSHNGSPTSTIDGRSPPRVVYVDRSALAAGVVVFCEEHSTEALTLCSSGSALIDTQLAIVDPESHQPVAANHVGCGVSNTKIADGLDPARRLLSKHWTGHDVAGHVGINRRQEPIDQS